MSVKIYGCDFYEDVGTFNIQKRPLGGKPYRLVAVSFGLLCILQATLNISMRLAVYNSEDETSDIDFEAIFKNVTEERDELKRKLNIFANYSRQGWMYFNDSFYYISSQQESWQYSRNDCLQRGAHLVIINSKEEQQFTRQFQKHVWIGLTDRETEGVWKWVDGTLLTTSYWGINEPNSHEGTDEDCAEIKFFDEENSWNDKPCEIQNIWICEKKVVLT
ncbi:CD209 antigen-like protein C [Micropterus salmoides]|uniref:CD209 antigen-like protein C n=1 Tax=Micropterus salmoides TaxID=27706 RepID=UPI0018EA3740|nr:CD209 antigen-like protein C [Micropterus salmoides]